MDVQTASCTEALMFWKWPCAVTRGGSTSPLGRKGRIPNARHAEEGQCGLDKRSGIVDQPHCNGKYSVNSTPS